MKFLIPLFILLSFQTIFAEDGNGIDVCDCPELENLSGDVSDILEQAYANQGEVPPFSFDQFNLTLAIQLDADTAQTCIDQLTENLGSVETVSEDIPVLPNQLQLFRQASLEGRIMVYRAQVEGENRIFVLRRNEEGDVTVESFVDPTIVAETPLEVVPPADPSIRVETRDNGLSFGRVLPTDGGHLVETRLGFTCQGRPRPDGTCEANSVVFNGGATLTFGLDGPVDPNTPATGREIELSADVEDSLALDGSRLNREVTAGAIYRDRDQELRFNITDDDYSDPRYSFQFGNAGADGQEITAVRNNLGVLRPELFRLSADGTSPAGSSSSGGKGAPVPVEGDLSVTPSGDDSLYHFSITGEPGERPETLGFGLAEREGAESRYLLGSADFRSETYELAFGAGDADSRFNFEVDRSLYGGVDTSFLFQSERPLEEGDGTRRLTFGHAYDGQPNAEGVHTLSADVVDQRVAEGEAYANGDARRVNETTQRGFEYSSDNRVVLTYGRAVTETQIREGVPLRGPNGEQAGTQDIEIGSSSFRQLISLSMGEDSEYGLDALIESERRTGLHSAGYSLGISVADGERGRSGSAFVEITDSRGVLRSPCTEVSAEVTVSEGYSPGRGSVPRPNGAGTDGLACRFRYTNLNGQATQEFLVSRDQRLSDGSFLTQEYGFLRDHTGETRPFLGISGGIQLCGGRPCR
ncbi:MAG: hypothetical protein K9K67_15305 [Bacteriovoracaceae bacterium]|nr:hypothetical protein [Bacteriovoracaceae bacterium]